MCRLHNFLWYNRLELMITTVVLTHNSATTLADALSSVSWSDEILVIDDNSSDETLVIAKKHNARIISRAVDDDYAAQRNAGLAQAKGNWVLFLDSDETVTTELAKELQSVSRASLDVAGYYLAREDKLWGRVMRHGETSNVRLLRFARKSSGEWVRPVHEVWKVKGIVGTLTHPLLHSPHPNVAQFLDKISRYSTINAAYLYKQKTPSLGIHILAYPVAKFFVNYIGRLGFLDGTQGAIVAVMMSFHSFLTRAKLWLLYHRPRA